MTSNHSDFVSRLSATKVQTGVIFVCVFALLIESAYAIAVPPASGFETSVVRAYPLPFWVAFYTVIVGSIYLFVASAVSGPSGHDPTYGFPACGVTYERWGNYQYSAIPRGQKCQGNCRKFGSRPSLKALRPSWPSSVM